jgi:hypothetical protein
MESPYYPSVSTIEKKGMYSIRPSHSKKWFNIIYIYPHLMLQTLPHKTLSQSYPSTFREKENPLHPSKSRKRKPMPHHILPQLERENLYPTTSSHN